MSKKNGDTPKSITTNSQRNHIKKIAKTVLSNTLLDNTAAVQRERVLESLRLAGAKGITTIEFREFLNVMAPAPRIFELKQEGNNIHTIWTTSTNAQGNKHRNARYVLINTPSSSRRAA